MIGVGAEASSTEGLFSREVEGRCPASTSEGRTSSGSSVGGTAAVPRLLLALPTVDFLRRLCSTMSVSLLKLTTRWEISRKIELARAIGEGEGDNDLDLSRSPGLESNLLIALALLSLRLTPEPVSKVGKSSPNLEVDARPLPAEGDPPSGQCTLDLFACLSCLWPLFVEPEDLTEGCRWLLSVKGVVSLSGGENRLSPYPSLSFAGVVIIVGLRIADGGVAGLWSGASKLRARPSDASAKSWALSRGEGSPGRSRSV